MVRLFLERRQSLMKELDSFFQMLLSGEIVGHTITFSSLIFLLFRTSFIIVPPPIVSSERIKASISQISMVTPKGSFRIKQMTYIQGLMDLTNAQTFFILRDHGSSISLDFFLASSSDPDIPMYILLEAERTVQSNKTQCPRWKWSKVPPTATVSKTPSKAVTSLTLMFALMVGYLYKQGRNIDILVSFVRISKSTVRQKSISLTKGCASSYFRVIKSYLSRSTIIIII